MHELNHFIRLFELSRADLQYLHLELVAITTSMPNQILQPETFAENVRKSTEKFNQSKEIGFFSDSDGEITLSKKELHPYNIPDINHTHQSKQYNQCPFGWNTLLGHKSYIPKVYKDGESTIDNFLQSLVLLSKSGTDLSSYKMFCPSSFFQYIAIMKHSEFYIIRINNRLVIANSETRAGQNVKMSYVGIRFEDLLMHGPHTKTKNNYKLFESIIETKIGGLKSLFCAEIDSYDQKTGNYTEIKMILCKSGMPHVRMTQKNSILKILDNGNQYFEDFLFKLLTQCKFSGIKKVLIGTRDSSFNIRNITEFDIDLDLIPYFKNCYPRTYKVYLKAIDNIENVIKTICKNISERDPIYKLSINNTAYKLESVDLIEQRRHIFNTVMIPEFIELIKSF